MDKQEQKKFYIDPNILAILYNLELEIDVEEAYINYTDGLQKVINQGVSAYIKEKGLSEEDRKELVELYNEIMNPENVEPDQEKAKRLQELMQDPQLQQRLEMLINEFNKIVYSQKVPSLDQEAKNQLNQYIKSMEKANKQNLEIALSVNKVLDVIKTKERNLKSGTTSNQPEIPQINLSQTDSTSVPIETPAAAPEPKPIEISEQKIPEVQTTQQPTQPVPAPTTAGPSTNPTPQQQMK